MIIVRTPLLISIGGGGSALPSYYEKFGSFFISAAIDKYVYISINKTSRMNTTSVIPPRSALPTPSKSSIRSCGRPSSFIAGLGSSGSFTVGLLRAIYAYRREPVTTSSLAEEACHIEMSLGRLEIVSLADIPAGLKEPVGKQDQYITAVRHQRL
jgi:D-glycero-alpha-D-manno-heptose-7-phosphate kinase